MDYDLSVYTTTELLTLRDDQIEQARGFHLMASNCMSARVRKQDYADATKCEELAARCSTELATR